jgi:molybdopterin-binding protein
MADAGLAEVMERAMRHPRASRLPTPEFDGKTDVTRFRRTFEEVAEASEWDPAERALRLKLALRGTAADYVQGETYDELMLSLVNRFEMTAEEARRALKALRLKSGQDVYAFADEVMKLVRLSEPRLGAVALDHRATREFVDAIGDKHLTREFRFLEADNFADAVRRVQQFNSDMKNSTIRRLDSEEAVSQEKRMCAMEKILQELASGQNELKAEQVARETVLVKNIGEVFRETLRKHVEAKTPTKRPPVNCYNSGVVGHHLKFYKEGRPANQMNFEHSPSYRGSRNDQGPRSKEKDQPRLVR